MAAEVEALGLRKTFGDVVAVDDADLHVPAGQFFTLLGPSGAEASMDLGADGLRSRSCLSPSRSA